MENSGQMPIGTADRSYVDWAAISGGAVIAVAIGLLATGFGAALGLSAISAEKGEGSGVLALVITALWIAISMVSAYAAGGYVAGRMRRRVDGAARDEVTVRDGLNGLIVWALGILLSALVLGSAVGTTVNAVGNVAATAATAAADVAGGAASGAISAAGNAAGSLVPDSIKNDPMAFITSSMLRPATVAPAATGSAATTAQTTEGTTPQTAAETTAQTTAETTADAGGILANLASTGEISDPDRAYLVQVTSARAGLTEQEAIARVDAAVTATKAARDKAAAAAADAEKAARDAAETARISAILTAFLLTAMALVSAVAAYIAAVRGGRHRDEGRIFGGFAYSR